MSKKLQQLSIFLENKIGSLYEIMSILSDKNIRIMASMVADTTEFGILRLITTDNEKAYEALHEAHKNCNRSDVIAISCDSLAGSFYEALRIFASSEVVIEYMYCFSDKNSAVMIMRVNDIEKALSVAEKEEITTLSNDDLADL